MKSFNSATGFLLFTFAFFFAGNLKSAEQIQLFPLEKYDQEISHWIPESATLDEPFLSTTQIEFRKKDWNARYYGAASPWNKDQVTRFLSLKDSQSLLSQVKERLKTFDIKELPKEKKGYAPNFREYPVAWFGKIISKIDFSPLEKPTFSESRRAILVQNVQGRLIPTDEPFYYDFKIPGEGYPFDNAEAAVLWAGTPVYLLTETKDHEWGFVLSPQFAAWVKMATLAKVNRSFIERWEKENTQSQVAIMQTEVPIADTKNAAFKFMGYLGMFFPGKKKNTQWEVSIPVADESQNAVIRKALMPESAGSLMPLLPTRRNFTKIIEQLKGRPYGWGGLYFYNDCASEIKNLLTPFQIWIPVHSSEQVNPERYVVDKKDFSDLPASQRITKLAEEGHPFMTIVYIGGHVFLYLGKYTNPRLPNAPKQILTYQNIWGLRPKASFWTKDRRDVVGGAVLFPLLESFPEASELVSLAAKKFFTLGHIDGKAPSALPEFAADVKYLLNP